MRWRLVILVVLATALGAAPVVHAGDGDVPYAYQRLFRELDGNLSLLEETLKEKESPPGPTVFAVELLVANGHRGEKLLTPSAWIGTLITLDKIKDLGVTGVSISIPYPLLTPKISRHEDYIDFYRHVIEEAKKRGFVVLVDLGAIFPEPEFSSVPYSYSLETRQSIREGMINMAKVILSFGPDYLSLPSEPDTFARNVGKRVTDGQWVEMIAGIAEALPRTPTKIGAGAGTWSPMDLFENMVGIRRLDYIDMHIYPIQGDFIFPKIPRIAALAERRGKGIIVGEAWLYKVAGSELGTKIAGSPLAFARDAYGFWEPLDARFVKAMIRLSRRHRFEYLSFFWMRNFYAYLNYDQVSGMSPASVFEAINAKAAPNIAAGSPNRLGITLRDEIRKQDR